MVARNIEFEETTAITTAAAQQQSKNEPNQYALQLQIAIEQMGAAMQVMADQKRRNCRIAEVCFGYRKQATRTARIHKYKTRRTRSKVNGINKGNTKGQ